MLFISKQNIKISDDLEQNHKSSIRMRGGKMVDSATLTRTKYFQKLGLTKNIWGNIMGRNFC